MKSKQKQKARKFELLSFATRKYCEKRDFFSDFQTLCYQCNSILARIHQLPRFFRFFFFLEGS